MICPRCKKQADKLILTPPGEAHKKVCKKCSQLLWLLHDREAGLEIPAGISKKNASKCKRQYEPTERHGRIAEIACALGVQADGEDIRRIYEAARIEHEGRTGTVGRIEEQGRVEK